MQPETYTTPSPQQPINTPPRRGNFRVVISTIGIVLAAIAVAFIVMMFVFRSYQVDGPSMQPTLQHNDRLIIWKLSKTWASITGKSYVPNRGDIIVFVERGLVASDGSTKQLIKRVIGVPGDRIVISDGIVTVYNDEHPDGFSPDTTMPYGEGLTLATSTEQPIDETVGENEVYVLGDNRDNSLDSRVFGPLSTDDVVGKLVLRMFPVVSAKRF